MVADEINFKVSRPRELEGDFESFKSPNHNELPVNKSESPKVIKATEEPKQEISLRRSERLKIRPPLSYDESHHNELLNYAASAQAEVGSLPLTYDDIKTRPDKKQWELAIKDELDSLRANNTWTIVPKPLNKNIVSCKWIFTIKTDVQGNPQRYKARLVARGFNQTYPADYTETFAPVARISTFRLLLAIANQFNLLVHHMDVKTAFLNGTLNEEIYMQVPDGVKTANNQVCKLNKALYGLKQASRRWFEHFDSIIKAKGFQNSAVDHCLYYLNKGHVSKNIYIVLYVDDLIIATQDKYTMFACKKYLMTCFEMRDLNEVRFFLRNRN